MASVLGALSEDELFGINYFLLAPSVAFEMELFMTQYKTPVSSSVDIIIIIIIISCIVIIIIIITTIAATTFLLATGWHWDSSDSRVLPQN